jgi:hypothetical protein
MEFRKKEISKTKNPEPQMVRDSLMAKEIIFSRSGIFSVPFRNPV